MKKLKNYICEHQIDFTFIIWAERLILKQCSWIICRVTPNDILESFFFTYFSPEIFNIFFKIIQSLIQFVFTEYNIYSKYDMLVIVLACIYFTILNIEGIEKEIKEKTYLIFCEKVKKINFIDWIKVEECINDIIILIKEDENEIVVKDEMNYDKCLTRSSSSSSLVELFNSFDKKKEKEKNISQNKFNHKIDNIEPKDKVNYLGKKRKIKKKSN